MAQVKSGELSLSEAPSTFSFRFFNAIKSVSPLPSHAVDLSNHTCSLSFSLSRLHSHAGEEKLTPSCRDEPSGLNRLPPSAEVSSRRLAFIWRQAPHSPCRTRLRRNHNSLDLW